MRSSDRRVDHFVRAAVGAPNWLREGLRTEYYIKTGLVLFAMAFVSIGLETSLMSVVSTGGGRPAVAFGSSRRST